jgi:hypothetical protein
MYEIVQSSITGDLKVIRGITCCGKLLGGVRVSIQNERDTHNIDFIRNICVIPRCLCVCLESIFCKKTNHMIIFDCNQTISEPMPLLGTLNQDGIILTVVDSDPLYNKNYYIVMPQLKPVQQLHPSMQKME